MKKFLPLLIFVLVASLLCGCMSGTVQCTTHTDADRDLACDTCGAAVACTDHADANEDLKCDYCTTAMECTSHKDTNLNLECDKCGAALPCPGHVNEDSDKNLNCDICGEALPCESHKDDNGNLKCDLCNKDMECTHIDANNDGICDVAACLWDYDHTHTYSPAWEHDTENHWHAATCSHSVKSDVSAHADANSDGICDGCAWDYDHEHTFETEWTTDENGHWYKATCPHDVKKDAANHVDENGICSVCEYVICTHTFSDTEWVGDETGHWHKPTCNHPNAKDEVLAHDFNSEDVCTVCGEKRDHVHTFETEWTTDENGHWYKATCGHATVTKDKALHSECDEDNDGICDVCEVQFCNHENFGTAWKYDAYNHWHEATCYHVSGGEVIKSGLAAHTDGNNDGVCDACAYQLCNHPLNTEAWLTNNTHHWHDVTCTHDAKGDLGLHSDYDENNDGVCDVCSYKYNCQHTYDDKWSYDNTHHWHQATCDHNYTKDKAHHTDIDGNLICDTCECDYEDTDTEYPEAEGDAIILPGHVIGGKS